MNCPRRAFAAPATQCGRCLRLKDQAASPDLAQSGGTRMRFVGPTTFGALVLLCTLPAQALTISNIDPKPHKVTVRAGGSSNELTVEAGKQVDATCSDGCKVKLESGEEYELKG